MARSKPGDGHRDLSLIRASGSTARVLNLALAFERFGASAEFLAKPLFRIPKLNRALIFKHIVRDHERALFVRAETHTTKLVIPYSPTELELGGASLMVGEKKFDQLMRKAVGASVNEDDYASDLELIEILHEMPSFDPFMMREHLKRAGREPARCFFEISDADISSMHEFVCAEIEPLVGLAFGAGGRRADTLSARLAEKLMTDENAQMLDPLRGTLRLSVCEFGEGVFAWKGFLYYKWMLGDFAAQQQAFASSFLACAIASDDRRVRHELEVLRQSILQRMDMVTCKAGDAMKAYARAFSSLMSGESGAFRAFLLSAPAQFLALGEAVGAVKHIYSFWKFRFPASAPQRLDAEEAQEMLQDFDRVLSGLQLIRPPGANEMLL